MVDEKSNGHGKASDVATSSHSDGKYDQGMMQVYSESSVEREFMTPGASPEETIAKTKLLDFNELNDLARYYDWCEDFRDEEALRVLNFWMNGKRSIGGFSFIHALFAKVGIVSPEALGVKISKGEAQAINKFQSDRNSKRNDRRNKEDED